MEQGGISIISSSGITENSVGKSKSIGITLRSSNGGIRSAKEKLKAPWLRRFLKEEEHARNLAVILLAEVMGTTILVMVGCLSCIGSMGIAPQRYQTAVVFGSAVMIAIQCFGHISGSHINPSISLASLIIGKKSLPVVGMYMVAQCLGGILGFGVLKIVTPSHLLNNGDPDSDDSFCVTAVNEQVSLTQGLMVEILATLLLVIFACAIWDPRNKHNSDSIPLRFGVCIAVLSITFGPYSGCSMNPARSFGPAIWNGNWRNHWVYWVGPLTGSTIGSSIYRFVFSRNNPTQETVSGTET